MTLTVDREFEHFLAHRPLNVIWLEKPIIPARELAARIYQEETDLILAAMRSGSRARLELALTQGLAA